MAGRLKFPYICLSIFLLVLPLVCSENEENNGKNDMKELLQNLLKAEKERRQQSDDTNAKGSGGNEQGRDDENVPDIETEKRPDGSVETDVKVNNEMTQKIIQDCGNKYELTLIKNADNAEGKCYLHKMNDRVYEKDCKGITTEEEIKIKYQIGNVIENTTLLSSIKGIDGCNGKPVIEMTETSVKKRYFDEYEKSLAARRCSNPCVLYTVECHNVCVERAGWWWSDRCVKECLECTYGCRYNCR